MINNSILFYTYLDECKKNYFTTEFYQSDPTHENYNFYSLSSVSFESEYYRETFEAKWHAFKTKFSIPDKTCLHFAEYKKLLSSDHVSKIELILVQEAKIFGPGDTVNLEELNTIITGTGNDKLIKELESIEEVSENPSVHYEKSRILFKKYMKTLVVDEKDISGYKLFCNPQMVFDIKIVFNFFLDLKTLLEESTFYILNTDYINLKKAYLPIRKKTQAPYLSKPNILPAKNLAKAEPRVTMKKHLDILIEFLISNEFEGERYLDENLPDLVYTKLRFDADGKEFEARNDLKMAFHECSTIGTERFSQKTAVNLLDEIRFIRKEEVGSGNIPPHCGSELVDFLCSLVCSETRVAYLIKMGIISEEDFPKGKYSTLVFEEELHLEDISFGDIIKNKLILNTTIDYS